MDDTGPLIGMNIKIKKLESKVKKALELLKMENPDIERVIRILEEEGEG